eukprot:Sspe_Gene.81809::Locus_52953_Transcript_1_1_Confidence_1.000_Length_781::g.81809::m.81809
MSSPVTPWVRVWSSFAKLVDCVVLMYKPVDCVFLMYITAVCLLESRESGDVLLPQGGGRQGALDMTYVVLHVPSDKPPPHHSAPDLPEEDKRVIAGLCGGNPTVEISLGTTHVYRRTDKMGCMPPKVPQPAATTALAVMTYGYVSLVQFARFVAKECTGRVFRVVYFRGPSYSHLFFIDAHRIAVAEELHSKFSGAPIGDDTAAVAVSFPLLSSYFDKMPIC